jgi:hypothetical protein
MDVAAPNRIARRFFGCVPIVTPVRSSNSALAALARQEKTFEPLVLILGVYVFVRRAIWLSFGLLAATARDCWWPFVVNGIVGIAT